VGAPPSARFTALVLAGSRGGAGDDLAEAQGQRHRALIPVRGVPMLVRVIRTLRAAPSVERIVISIDDPSALDEVPELRALIAEGALEVRRSQRSPSRSVVAVLESLPAGEPVLVTTADHALLTPEMVEHFTLACRKGDADLRVALVAASLLQARFPESKRTYLPLRDDRYTYGHGYAMLFLASVYGVEEDGDGGHLRLQGAPPVASLLTQWPPPGWADMVCSPCTGIAGEQGCRKFVTFSCLCRIIDTFLASSPIAPP
jgi:GTP:adenosylcobinamide-phosphate guanylyltransferase